MRERKSMLEHNWNKNYKIKPKKEVEKDLNIML